MNRTDTDARTDGGHTADSPFDTVSESEEAPARERAYIWFDRWIKAPFLVMWEDWRARVGLIIISIYVLMGTVGVVLVEPTTANEGKPYIPWFQTLEFPLGTGGSGQDLFALVIHSTPAMWEMILAGGIVTIVVATIVGTVAGYKGGLIDEVLTLFTDIVMNIPGLPLLVVIAALFQPREAWQVGLILSVNAWAGLARSLRSQVLTLRDEDYVEASRLMGASTASIIGRDIIPNMMPLILISFVNAARNVIFASVGLYFLGILPYSNSNWGVILNSAYRGGGMSALALSYWVFVPMIAIVGLSVGLILVSQGLDRVFNPRVRARHTETVSEDDGVA